MLSSATFVAMGCLNTVSVRRPGALATALAIVQAEVAAIDRACSRFRADSELEVINGAGGGTFTVSPLLEEALAAALHTAAITAGLVDLTVGRRLRELGYTATFTDLPADGPPARLEVWRRHGWESLRLDRESHQVTIPAGVTLDLGASGKAWAADRAARRVESELGVEVAVSCGGDVAVRGGASAGWPVRVALDAAGARGQDVTVFDGGLASSGVHARRWRRGGFEMHHLVDPRTGLPAVTPWAMVTAAAASCVDANAAATAAVILGAEAPRWLDERGLPARLVSETGDVVAVGGWRC